MKHSSQYQLNEERLRCAALEAEIATLKRDLEHVKRVYRATTARIVESLPPHRLFCDHCIHWDSGKCTLGHKDLFFRVPASYGDINERNWGWFRKRKCVDYAI